MRILQQHRFGAAFLRCWRACRHFIGAILVLLNALMIIESVESLPFSLRQLFEVTNYTAMNFVFLTNAPYFMLGVFLALCGLGLLFRAKLAWILGVILMMIATGYGWVNFHEQWVLAFYFPLFSLCFLILIKGDYYRSTVAAGSVFALSSFSALLLYSAYGALYFGDGFSPKITSLMTAFYYATETMTTVGYGDIVPVTTPARLFTMSVIVAGITVFATSASSVFGPLISGGFHKLMKEREPKVRRENHFIIVGLSSLGINTAKQLLLRNQKVTFLTGRNEDEVDPTLKSQFDILFGDPNDETLLVKAGIGQAKSALALSDNDADNAFFILSVKEMNKDLNTVVVVNESRNMNKIKRVQPDIVLSPQLFASDILARLLNGESIDNDMLVSLLLTSVHGIHHESHSISEDHQQEDTAKSDSDDQTEEAPQAQEASSDASADLENKKDQ